MELFVAWGFGAAARAVAPENFTKLIRPAFDKDLLESDIELVPKGASIVVNTKTAVYLKLGNEERVYKFPGMVSYLGEDAPFHLETFSRQKVGTRGVEFDQAVEREQAELANVFGEQDRQLQERAKKLADDFAQKVALGAQAKAQAAPQQAARRPTRHTDLDDEHGFEPLDQVPALDEQIVAEFQAQAQHERERMDIEEADAAAFDEHCASILADLPGGQDMEDVESLEAPG